MQLQIPVPASDRARWWPKLQKDPDPEGCWRWTAGLSRNGYGAFWWAGKHRRAHVVSYLWFVGPIAEGLHVTHRCPGGGNRWCVNPAHLLATTRAENMRHASETGNTASGDRNGMRTHPHRHWVRSGSWYRPITAGMRNGNAKLTDELILDVRRRYAAGEPQKDIARDLKMSRASISMICRRDTWRHLP